MRVRFRIELTVKGVPEWDKLHRLIWYACRKVARKEDIFIISSTKPNPRKKVGD